MSYLSFYCRRKLLELSFGLGTFPKPTIYVGLGSESPIDPPGTMVEIPNQDYKRKKFSQWGIVPSRRVINNRAITFNALSDWGLIRYFSLWDARVGGNLLGYGSLDTVLEAPSGAVLSFGKGKLIFDILSGTITNYFSTRIIQHIFGDTELTPFETYIGLSYSNLTDDGGHPSEPTNPEYHAIPFDEWDVSDDAMLQNGSRADFPLPSSNWGNIKYSFVKDSYDRALLYGKLSQEMMVDVYSPIFIEPYHMTFVFE